MADHMAARRAALLGTQTVREAFALNLLTAAERATDHFTAGVYIDAARAVFGTGLMGSDYDDDWRLQSADARRHYHALSDAYTAKVRADKLTPLGCAGCGESFTTPEEREQHTEACRGTAYIL